MFFLFDGFNLPEDIFEVIFATKQQTVVGKALVNFMKDNNNEITKTEMSLFATKLHDGIYETEVDLPEFLGKRVKLNYNKRQFYDRILTPFKSMGVIDYDLYKKTYKLSDMFNREMLRIGLMWTQELRKPALNIKVKKKT